MDEPLPSKTAGLHPPGCAALTQATRATRATWCPVAGTRLGAPLAGHGADFESNVPQVLSSSWVVAIKLLMNNCGEVVFPGCAALALATFRRATLALAARAIHTRACMPRLY